jgi:hypothetical protein
MVVWVAVVVVVVDCVGGCWRQWWWVDGFVTVGGGSDGASGSAVEWHCVTVACCMLCAVLHGSAWKERLTNQDLGARTRVTCMRANVLTFSWLLTAVQLWI